MSFRGVKYWDQVYVDVEYKGVVIHPFEVRLDSGGHELLWHIKSGDQTLSFGWLGAAKDWVDSQLQGEDHE